MARHVPKPLALLLAALLIATLLPAAATANDLQPQIIEGEPVTGNDQPWVTAILFDADDPFNSQYCGGSLIAPDWVLTAAHCEAGEGDFVAVSTVDLNAPGEIIEIAEGIPHPDYDEDTVENDIALLRLAEPASVTPVPIVHGGSDLAAAGAQARVWGWGSMTAYAPGDEPVPEYPSVLHTVGLPVLSAANCASHYGGEYVDAVMLCAGALVPPGVPPLPDSCQGDSGGPLAVPSPAGHAVAGIVSFGAGCGFGPGVYARVSSYTDWIEFYTGPLEDPDDPDDPDDPSEFGRRVAGDDRYATAVAAARSRWNASTEVVVASGQDFADALAGTALAAANDAPLVLTRSDRLPNNVAQVITDLGATEVIVLGGPAAIGEDARDALLALPNVEAVNEIAGANRYSTAAQAAVAAGAPNGTVAIASGQSFADGVSAATLSVGGEDIRMPILLADGDSLSAETIDALEQLEVTEAFIIGGPVRIGTAIEDELEDLGVATERLAGADRYTTSQAVAAQHGALLGQSHGLVVASGADFPDALTAGAYAARGGEVVLLAPPAPQTATTAWVQQRAGLWGDLSFMGGPSAIRNDAVDAITEAAAAG